MNAFVLIVFLVANSGPYGNLNSTMSMQSFSSKENCENAMQVINARRNDIRIKHMECVPQ